MSAWIRRLTVAASWGCAAGALIVAAGCSGPAEGASNANNSGSGPPSPTVQAGSPAPSDVAPTDHPKTHRPPAPLASPYKPVDRPGVAAQHSIHAERTPFEKTVRYPDEVSLEVLGIEQGVTSGHGPGVIRGRTTSTFELKFVNGSQHPINLDHVVVTATYGDPARVAYPVYQGNEEDFAGKVAPDESVRAVYSFAIPKSALSHVVMHVDFDGRHAAATFAGSVK